jgi:hypothetical protein
MIVKQVVGTCTMFQQFKYSSGKPYAGCPAGYYCTDPDNGSYAKCKICPPGSYCRGGVGTSASMNQCPIGNYCPEEGTIIPSKCPDGYIGSGTGAVDVKACFKCPKGTYQLSAYQTCQLCDGGTYADKEGMKACTHCPAGKYDLKGLQGNVDSSVCVACPSGKSSYPAMRYSCVNSATNCGSGYYMTSPTTNPGKCMPCDKNTYSSDGTKACIQCPLGKRCAYSKWYTQPNNIQTNDNLCTNANSCRFCVQGWETDYTNGGCSACADGKYRGSTSQSSCTTVSGTRYSSFNKAAQVSGCNRAGWYASASTKQCKMCPAGRWSSATSIYHVGACKICPNGFSSQAGQPAQDGCIACSPGSYAAAPGEACTKCPAASFQPLAAQLSCQSCQSGFSSPVGSISETSCYACDIGKYALLGTGCQVCPVGTWQGKIGAGSPTDCIPCAAGKTSKGSSTSIEDCTYCAAGKYSLESSECLTCPKGFYSYQGMSSCNECPAGKYSAAGAIECTACANGKFSAPGSDSCDACSA